LFRILEGFPDLAHDDEVDACSGALEMLNVEMKGWGIFELYRQRAEKLKGPTMTTWVRLRPPPGKEVGGLYLGPQRDFRIRADGTFDLPAEDPKFLIEDGWTKIAEWTCEDAAGCVMKTPSIRPD